MSNTFLLKKSSVAAKVPLTTDLAYGEIALNYADGKLYYKTSGNAIDSIPSASATATLTNKTLTSPTINGGALSGTFSGVLTLSDTTASTSTTTGAVKIAGGLGVAGTIFADQIRLTNNGNGTNVYIGDDIRLGDINAANTLGIYGIQDSTKGYIVFGSSNNTAYIGRDGTNPITLTGQFIVSSGSTSGTNGVAMQINGYAAKGGTGYHDFLSVTNTYASATNPNKFFRLNTTGNLEIINSAYTANIFTLTDAGVLSVPQISAGGSTGTNGQVLQSTGTGLQWATIAGSGTVTNIATGTGLTGGPITSTGTISIDTSVVTTLTGVQTLTNKTLSSPVISTISNGAATITIPTTTGTLALQGDTHYIGTTSVALNRASANLALTGISSVTLPGSTSGTIQIIPAAVAGTGTVLTLPATTGTVITTGDTGTVTNTMLAGSIANAKLANSTISGVALGSNLNTLTIGTGLSGTSYNGSAAVTIALANTAVTAGSYGSSTSVPVITVDAQGRITAASTAAISGSLTFTGDVTGTGSTGSSTALTLATVNSNIGTFNNVTVNAKGLVTAASNVAYLTSYTETDTLATVTARGASTSIASTFSGGLTASSVFTQSGGFAYIGNYNIGPSQSRGLPASNNAVSFTWNLSDGSAESNIWNTSNPTTYSGTGLRFLQWLTTTTYRDLMFLRQDGALSFGGVGNIGTAGQVLQTNGAAAPTWVNLPTIGNGTFGVSIGTAGATNTTVTWGTSSGFSANTGSNYTYDLKVGPALTALAALMTTGGTGFIKRGATADTYSIDTNAYLTAEADTLATVTARGATTSTAVTISNKLTLNPTGVNQSVSGMDVNITGTGTYQRGIRVLNSGMTATDSLIGVQVGQADSNKNAGQLYFYYAGASSTSNRLSMGLHSVDDVFNILGTGFVGIGTTNPSFKLSVITASDVWHTQIGTSGGKQLRIGGSTTNGSVIGAYNDDNNNNPASLLLNRDGGSVGIGTAAPALTSGYAGLNVVNNGYTQLRLQSSNGSGGLEFKPSSGANWEMQGTTNNTFILYDRTNSQYRWTIATSGNMSIGWNNDTDQGYKLAVNGSFAATSKSFLIPHPTKESWKLRYGSLEGPENGVYIRGKLKGKNKIELPEYWTKLVDPDSITVTLTPIGKHQKLYVEDIANNVVTVANDGLFAGEINCFFVVYGERVDIDKLIVEYEE